MIALVGDALAEDALEVLSDWELESDPGTFAFPLAEGGFVTASLAEGDEVIIRFERAGGEEVLAAPRRLDE